MLHNPKLSLRVITVFALLLFSKLSFSQSNVKWSVNGNATSNTDILGTTNNNPLVFYTNNLEAMRIKANGELKVNNLGGSGRGLIATNNNGLLSTTPFPQDTNKVFTGNGSFRNVSTLTGWTLTGNDIHNTNPGDVFITGTIHSLGLVLATMMEADTLKGASMISVNNNLNLSGGTLNEMYTNAGTLRIQSRTSYTGNNTVINAGNSGNVGVGINAPLYKMDILGEMRVSS